MSTAIVAHDEGIFTLDHVLGPEECRELIAFGEAHGFENAPINTPGEPRRVETIRNNDRVVFESGAWCETLWQRLKPHLGPADGAWPVGVNKFLRLYRYDPGQFFARHRDGTVRYDGLFSRLTVLVYLNDDYQGGATRFIDSGIAIRGKTGQALLFQHRLVHEGTGLTEGRKYLFRSDVMYLRPKPWETPPTL